MLFLLTLSVALQPVYARRQKPGSDTVVPQMTQDQQRFRYYFYEAQRCFDLEQYGRAMALMLFLNNLAPDTDAATNSNLGNMYRALGNTGKALHYYRLAYVQAPVAYWRQYVSYLLQKDEPAEAVQVLERLTKIEPKNEEVWEILVSVYARQEDYRKALKAQNKVEELQGINAANATNRYRLYAAMGKPKEAIAAIERYVEHNPEDYRMAALRADLYMDIRQTQKALQLYAEELERHPDNAYAYLFLSHYYREQNNVPKVICCVEQALRSEEWGLQEKLYLLEQNAAFLQTEGERYERFLLQLVDDYPLEEQAYKALSGFYIARKQYGKAKPLVQTMTDINPRSKETWHSYMALLQADSASTDEEYEQVIRKAYGYQPDDLEWTWWMARLLMIRGETDSAIVMMQTDIRQRTGNLQYKVSLWTLLGDIFISREQYDEAFAAYEETLKLSPDHIYTLNNYAYTLAVNGGDLKKAERMSQKTIEKEPDNATYLDTYAWILYLQGQYRLAEFYIQRALDNLQDTDDREELMEHYQQIKQALAQ